MWMAVQYCSQHIDGYFGELSLPLVSIRTEGECVELFGVTGS